MGGRYINLTRDSTRPLSRHGYFVRMSGLPFRATEDEIRDFFRPHAECVGVRVILKTDETVNMYGITISFYTGERALN